MKLVMGIKLCWIQEPVKTITVPRKPVPPTATATFHMGSVVRKVRNSRLGESWRKRWRKFTNDLHAYLLPFKRKGFNYDFLSQAHVKWHRIANNILLFHWFLTPFFKSNHHHLILLLGASGWLVCFEDVVYMLYETKLMCLL